MAYGTRRFNAAFTRALQSEALCDVSEHPCFYSVRLLASRQTPKLEDHSYSAVHDCFFNILAANLLIWKPTPPSATQGTRHAVVTGTHGWITITTISINYAPY